MLEDKLITSEAEIPDEEKISYQKLYRELKCNSVPANELEKVFIEWQHTKVVR